MLLVDENKEMKSPKISLWSRSGPSLLLAAFAIFLFKTAPLYWPLTFTAFLGYAFIHLWKKTGLILSLAGLCFVSILVFKTQNEHFWTSTLSASIALAWLLIYLGGQDAEAFSEKREEMLQSSLSECQNLEKQLREIKAALSSEKHRSNVQASESLHSLTKAAQSKEAIEKEKQTLLEKCNTLSKNVSIHLSNESSLREALARAESEISALRQQLVQQAKKYDDALLKTQVEDSLSEEQPHLKQLQCQLSLLREQFDEKSEALDKTRKELFTTENSLLTLQKAAEEDYYSASEEALAHLRDLKSFEQISIEMENELLTLHEIISSLLSPKARATPTKRTKARNP